MQEKAADDSGSGPAPACTLVARRKAKANEKFSRPAALAQVSGTITPAASACAGIVYLVGAGPGNPDLLTLRAAKLLGEADVVVYDRLIGSAILDFTRRNAQRIYVGKASGNHALPQHEINTLLVRLALEGRRVVRLKGGDPFIFGRGGEEIEALVARRIPFEIVPGITAASGIAAYAGIPLTHRDHAHAVTFVTGHLKDGTMDLDWVSLARPGQTVVVYMGLSGLRPLARQLIAHGLPAATPAAVVEHGTTARQRVITGTLIDLPERADAARFAQPTLIVIGEVVRLQKSFVWFDPAATDAHAPAVAAAAD